MRRTTRGRQWVSSQEALIKALWDFGLEDQLIFEVVNITSATTNKAQTPERKAKIVAFQEHSVDGKEAADFKQGANEAGREMVMGPLDPELGRKTQDLENVSRIKNQDFKISRY